MKKRSIYYLCLVLLLGSIGNLSAQRYTLDITGKTFTIAGNTYQGYSTKFIQPYKEVKKEWWRYINSRTVIFNKKTHLELTIPAQKKESNASLKFVSQTIQSKDKSTTTIRLALETTNVPDDQIKKLSVQAKHLLKDFKINYFTGLIQEKIDAEEAASRKISIQMDKLLLDNSQLQQWIDKRPDEKERFVKKLKANTSEIEKLQAKLNNSQQKLVSLKKELTLIK